MKTALLHYWLTNLRGGEKVLAALNGMFPEADIFTHAIVPEMRRHFPGKVTESFIASLPRGRRSPQIYLPLMPRASRRFDLSGYDLIISSESGPIKGIRKPAGARHVCYCHTPMRYVWDMHDEYYRAAGLGGKLAMQLWMNALRRADRESAESVDVFIANSAFVAERIQRIYGRSSVVVPPPVEVDFFAGTYEKEDYFLLAGELIAYKRPELALEACVRTGRRIKVIGNGKLRAALERRYAANPLVTFLGRVDDETLRQTYGRARALLFPGLEDFGIVPVEAQAAGTPVIAYGRGGACETVVDGRTGLLFPEQTVESLCAALETFDAKTFDPAACRTQAARFTPEAFRAGIARVLGEGIVL